MKAVPSLCWVLTPESMLAESTVWGLMIYSLDDLQLEALCLLGVDLRPLVENMLMLALPVFFVTVPLPSKSWVLCCHLLSPSPLLLSHPHLRHFLGQGGQVGQAPRQDRISAGWVS